MCERGRKGGETGGEREKEKSCWGYNSEQINVLNLKEHSLVEGSITLGNAGSAHFTQQCKIPKRIMHAETCKIILIINGKNYNCPVTFKIFLSKH